MTVCDGQAHSSSPSSGMSEYIKSGFKVSVNNFVIKAVAGHSHAVCAEDDCHPREGVA